MQLTQVQCYSEDGRSHRAEEMAGEKKIACCVRDHVYKDIWATAIREVLMCSMEPTNVAKIFVVKLYSRKIFSYVFCIQKYFYNKNKANYGRCRLVSCIGTAKEETFCGIRHPTTFNNLLN